jgi:hypothetical protein
MRHIDPVRRRRHTEASWSLPELSRRWFPAGSVILVHPALRLAIGESAAASPGSSSATLLPSIVDAPRGWFTATPHSSPRRGTSTPCGGGGALGPPDHSPSWAIAGSPSDPSSLGIPCFGFSTPPSPASSRVDPHSPDLSIALLCVVIWVIVTFYSNIFNLNLRCCKYLLQNYVIPVFTEYIYNMMSLQLLQSSNMHFKIIAIAAAVKMFENIFTIFTIVTACWNDVIAPTNVVNYENVPKYFCNSHHCNCMLECCNRAD